MHCSGQYNQSKSSTEIIYYFYDWCSYCSFILCTFFFFQGKTDFIKKKKKGIVKQNTNNFRRDFLHPNSVVWATELPLPVATATSVRNFEILKIREQSFYIFNNIFICIGIIKSLLNSFSIITNILKNTYLFLLRFFKLIIYWKIHMTPFVIILPASHFQFMAYYVFVLSIWLSFRYL